MLAAATDPVGDFLRSHPWVIAVTLPAFFVILGFAVLNFIGKVSGWAALAENYRAMAPFYGEKWRFQSARMRYLSNYNGCLTFGANEYGMYAAGWGPFRIGAAPLLVPWSELTVEKKSRWLFPGYEMRFRQCPDVYMWVRESLGDKMLRASSSQMVAGVRMAPPIG